MSIAAECILSLLAMLILLVPILAVIMCTNLQPRTLFQKLGASRVLRHWAIVLVVACSAVMGAWGWAVVYTKYHVAQKLRNQEEQRSQQNHRDLPLSP